MFLRFVLIFFLVTLISFLPTLLKRLGGSAAVASFAIKKLGLDSSFIGRLGDDDVYC